MQRTNPARVLIAAAAATTLLVAGCSGSKPADSATAAPSKPISSSAPASASPSATTPTKVSDNLDDVTVTGKFGETPAVSVPAPWGISDTKVKVLTPATDGAAKKVVDTDTVTVNYQGVDARTGKVFDESFSKGQPATFPLNGVVAGFKKAIVDQQVGSRVLVAMTGPDGYDSQGGQAQAGINVGDTLVFVIDILGVQLTHPEGDEQAQDPALPQVSPGTDKPTVTIPQGYAAPAEAVSKPIIVGKGDKVLANDVLTVNYQAVSLKTGQVVEETYGAEPQQGALTGLIQCWQKGLVDKTVGSRVLLVCPPATAYPEGNATPKVDAGDTLIYVVDVLNRAAGQ